MAGHIIFSHGFTSGPLSKGITTGPEGAKVSALAATAESLGWTTDRPDFREDDAAPHDYALCIEPRLKRLEAAIALAPSPPVLMGTSIGAYVCALAASRQPVAGLFLLAMPTRIPGYPAELSPRGGAGLLVHGYDDDICPVEEALEFARSYGMSALLLKQDHFLKDSLELLSAHFAAFLATLEDRSVS
jgi:alpha/beta superfamily hydrolase